MALSVAKPMEETISWLWIFVSSSHKASEGSLDGEKKNSFSIRLFAKSKN